MRSIISKSNNHDQNYLSLFYKKYVTHHTAYMPRKQIKIQSLTNTHEHIRCVCVKCSVNNTKDAHSIIRLGTEEKATQ